MTTLLKNRVGEAPATDVPDVSETTLIEQDPELYERITERLANPGTTIAAEELLGNLDEDGEGE